MKLIELYLCNANWDRNTVVFLSTSPLDSMGTPLNLDSVLNKYGEYEVNFFKVNLVVLYEPEQ